MIKSTICYLGFAILGICFSAVGRTKSGPSEVRPMPAATFYQFECSGFISAAAVPVAVQVYNGPDNDLYEPLDGFVTGDYVYLHGIDNHAFIVGQSYSLVRPENGFDLTPEWLPGMLENQIQPPISRYPRQRFNIKSLGRPYDRTGTVQVTKVTPEGAIAKVVFTCDGINIGDIGLPYAPPNIPQYTPSVHLRRFAPPNGKLEGIIVAAAHGTSYLGEGTVGFLNIGRDRGVAPGQRFRIFAIFRDNLPEDLQGIKPHGETPRETVGEFVILRVQEKSATGIVVNSLREIAVGDGVELE
jgi:hypothetical protein